MRRQQGGQVNRVGSAVIVVTSFTQTLSGLLKDHAVTVFTTPDTQNGQDSNTTSLDSSGKSGGPNATSCVRVMWAWTIQSAGDMSLQY
jgi:hypothetical protein